MSDTPDNAIQARRATIPGALAHIDDQHLLDRISAGERPSHIAEQLGVHKSALYHRFADNKAYIAARTSGQEIRLDDSERNIETATDNFTLSRARDVFRAVAWRAEREFPDRWGAKPVAAGSINVQIVLNKPDGNCPVIVPQVMQGID